MELLTELFIAGPHTNAELQGNLLRHYENCAPTPVSRLLKKGRFIITLDEEGPVKLRIYVESFRYLEAKKHPE